MADESKDQAPREIEVTFGKGVKGSLTIPKSADCKNPFEHGLQPVTNKVALVLHGQGGHRNYCYQQILSKQLSDVLSMYTLKIDFRGCGASADNEDPKKGRVLEQDIEDLEAAIEFLKTEPKKLVGTNLNLTAIVAHSRGSVAMFLWALKQNELIKRGEYSKATIVPNLVNCSGRFRLNTVFERFTIDPDEFEGVYQMAFRHGKLQDVFFGKDELLSLATADLSGLSNLSPEFSVMSIYGLLDKVIRVTDSAIFANVLNRGPFSHRLELIEHADHNFLGNKPLTEEDDAEDFNAEGLPLTRKKLVNYNYVVVPKIIDYLSPENELARFAARTRRFGEVYRWKKVEGVSNFRDIGGWNIQKPAFLPEGWSTDDELIVKPNILFRSASLTRITPEGLKRLQDLNIKIIFDFRSIAESEKEGLPRNLENFDLVRENVPVFNEDDYSPQSIVLQYFNLVTSWHTYVHVYDDILSNGTKCFRRVFEFIRDESDKHALLFHCAAGKDRTGVFAMLVLLFVGVDKFTIAKEYELTTLGLIPDHKFIKDLYIKTLQKLKSKGGDLGALIEKISLGRKNWSIEEDGFRNLVSSRADALLATMDLLDEKYGGVYTYMTKNLGFTDADLSKIFTNLVEKTSSSREYVTELDTLLPSKVRL